MPAFCCIIGCSSRGGQPGRSFSSFPMLRRTTSTSLALTQARQHAWIHAINRSDFFASQFKHARVCDRHFHSGKACYYTKVNHPDWVPSLNLGYEALDEYHTINKAVTNDKETQTSLTIADASTQTDGTITGMSEEMVVSYSDVFTITSVDDISS